MRPIFVLGLIALLAASPLALACPNCKEAVAAAGDEYTGDDPFREARAYNWSIYFMLAVPYSILGTAGFVGYRYYRNARPCRSPEV